MKHRPAWWTAPIAAALVLGAVSTGTAGQAAKTDVSGIWAFTVQSAAGTGTPTVTLKQAGEKLTGHYSSQLLGEAELTGTVKGQTITFTVVGEIQGMKLELRYNGTVESKDSMKGTLSAGELGDGTFTAQRK